MKLFVVFLIFACGLVAYLVLRSRPKLVAVSDLGGRVVIWGNSDSKETKDEKTKQLEEIFQLTKHLLPQTLEGRKKARGGTFGQDRSATVYFVENEKWLYIFADSYPYKVPGMEVVGNGHPKNSTKFHCETREFELHAD